MSSYKICGINQPQVLNSFKPQDFIVIGAFYTSIERALKAAALKNLE